MTVYCSLLASAIGGEISSLIETSGLVAKAVLIILLLFGAGFAGGEAFWGDYYFALGAAVGLAMLPLLYIRFRRKRRLKAFGTQLPFALDLIKGSLEAGHSLPRALQVLIGEFADPLGASNQSPVRSPIEPAAATGAAARWQGTCGSQCPWQPPGSGVQQQRAARHRGAAARCKLPKTRACTVYFRAVDSGAIEPRARPGATCPHMGGVPAKCRAAHISEV